MERSNIDLPFGSLHVFMAFIMKKHRRLLWDVCRTGHIKKSPFTFLEIDKIYDESGLGFLCFPCTAAVKTVILVVFAHAVKTVILVVFAHAVKTVILVVFAHAVKTVILVVFAHAVKTVISVVFAKVTNK